jgi:uncharacterized protein
MRRKDKEIADRAGIEAVLSRARVLCLAMLDEPAPYVIPVSFGFENGTLYVHGAPRGAKIDLLAAHPRVGFTAWADETLVTGEAACDFGVRASSVVGTGTARVLSDHGEKLRGLNAIMRHHGVTDPVYRPEALARTAVIAITVDQMRGKRVG